MFVCGLGRGGGREIPSSGLKRLGYKPEGEKGSLLGQRGRSRPGQKELPLRRRPGG